MTNEEFLSQPLSPHFRLGEFVRSATAVDLRIDNRPPAIAVEALRLLCEEVLEPLRRRFGCIRITSGYRCETLNRAVGGVANSQHLFGEAADIFVPNEETALKYIDFLRTHTPFDQLILEPRDARIPRWLHVSYTIRRPVRGQVL